MVTRSAATRLAPVDRYAEVDRSAAVDRSAVADHFAAVDRCVVADRDAAADHSDAFQIAVPHVAAPVVTRVVPNVALNAVQIVRKFFADERSR